MVKKMTSDENSILVVSVNDDRPTCNQCTCTVCISVWVLLNCSEFYYSVHCTCTHVLYHTFHFPKFHSTLCSAPSESHISLWSPRIVWQQSKNSAAAQPLIGIKHPTHEQFCVKLWLWQTQQTRQTRQASHQHAALRAEGRKTEGRELQHQPVDFGVWQDMSFSFSPWYPWLIQEKKLCFTYEIG